MLRSVTHSAAAKLARSSNNNLLPSLTSSIANSGSSLSSSSSSALSSPSLPSQIISQPYHTRHRKNNWEIMANPPKRDGKELVQRTWHLFDAQNVPVGRIANKIAMLLLGKHKPDYLPNQDNGDFVIVVNSDNIHFTGSKLKTKIYRKHTGYPGGLNEIPAKQMRERFSTQIVDLAVRSMLPKNRLRDARMSRLLVFEGPEHPYHSLFPDHTRIEWPSADDINQDDLRPVNPQEGWMYDLKDLVRYKEIDGVYVEEKIERFLDGKEPAPHKYKTIGFQ